MTGSRIFGLALWAMLATASDLAQSLPNADPISLTPSIIEPGSPVLIRVASSADMVDGEWLGHKLQFFRGPHADSWYALVGVDVEQATGPSTLLVNAGAGKPGEIKLNRAIEIHPAQYRTTALTVPPKFVEPGPEELKRIEAESQLKAKVFAASASEPLWHGSFRAPVKATPTDSFGTRRVFNGKLDSIHKGTDFRARMGTPVHAGNSGVVVLAQKLYFEGNCVIIDHGLGLFTLSMHLSRIEVHEGQHVVTGQLLGLSGATGRVTGPHLHWAVRWEGAYLDPAKLLRLNLNAAR